MRQANDDVRFWGGFPALEDRWDWLRDVVVGSRRPKE
jgi:hypothetical protein